MCSVSSRVKFDVELVMDVCRRGRRGTIASVALAHYAGLGRCI